MNTSERKTLINFFGRLGALLSAGVPFADGLDDAETRALVGFIRSQRKRSAE